MNERPRGIKSRYRNVPLPERIKAWVQLLRPYTLVAPAIAVLFGSIAVLAYNGVLDTFWSRWQTILYIGTTLTVLQGSGQCLNQACDPPELDRINGKEYRPVTRGVVSQEEALSLSFLLGIFGLARGFITSLVFGLFTVGFMFSIVFYNMEPFRFKKKLWLNEGLLAFSRGFLPLPAVWCVFGDVMNPVPWLIGFCLFLWVLAWQSSKDITDVEGDKEFNIRTPAVVYGLNELRNIALILSIGSFASLLLFIYIGILPISLSLLLLLLPLTLLMFLFFGREDMSVEELENSIAWQLFYLVLAGWFVLSAFGFVMF